MRKIIIDGNELLSWNSFHKTFKEKLKFPDYYGNNMDAWIDCVSDLFKENNILVIHINNIKIIKEKNHEIYEALIECASFVNYRFVSKGEEPVLALSFYN